jgi:hypothetical protein
VRRAAKSKKHRTFEIFRSHVVDKVRVIEMLDESAEDLRGDGCGRCLVEQAQLPRGVEQRADQGQLALSGPGPEQVDVDREDPVEAAS